MKTNQKGIDLMHEFEGCKLTAYLCPANIWTIGWGNTRFEDGTPVKQGDTVTQERANSLFLNIVKVFETGVRNLVVSKVNENQFSALVCFAYNVGLGNLKTSTFLRFVNENPNNPEIKNQFLRWNKAKGKELSGLTRRRLAESNLYFTI
jgi:lysozyme